MPEDLDKGLMVNEDEDGIHLMLGSSTDYLKAKSNGEDPSDAVEKEVTLTREDAKTLVEMMEASGPDALFHLLSGSFQPHECRFCGKEHDDMLDHVDHEHKHMDGEIEDEE